MVSMAEAALVAVGAQDPRGSSVRSYGLPAGLPLKVTLKAALQVVKLAALKAIHKVALNVVIMASRVEEGIRDQQQRQQQQQEHQKQCHTHSQP
mmetsp:Transcript_3286/g.8807  ORF Transcript_3286/g.8807 Transcript_3286/m.8807 type:complete len:94 (+) Transcript_3286:124-405(+)